MYFTLRIDLLSNSTRDGRDEKYILFGLSTKHLIVFFKNLIIIIIIIILLLFAPALADGFLLEFEWQQVSSRLKDFTQYSDRS